jgi:release factor glutamine methyltransferase
LCFFRLIAQGASAFLAAGGWLLLEMGQGQAPQVATILQEQGFTQIDLIPDHAGIKRVIKAQWLGQ